MPEPEVVPMTDDDIARVERWMKGLKDPESVPYNGHNLLSAIARIRQQRDALREAEGKLAEEQSVRRSAQARLMTAREQLAEERARGARLESALDDIKMHSSPGQKHFHASVLVARDAWDRAMEIANVPHLSSGPSALEAVRELSEAATEIPVFNERGEYRERFFKALAAVRAAFLGGER